MTTAGTQLICEQCTALLVVVYSGLFVFRLLEDLVGLVKHWLLRLSKDKLVSHY